MTVADVPTPSTSEIDLPAGSSRQRTGWASEASEEKKAQIAEVLSAVTIPEDHGESALSRGAFNSRRFKNKPGSSNRPPESMRKPPMKNKKTNKLFRGKKSR